MLLVACARKYFGFAVQIFRSNSFAILFSAKKKRPYSRSLAFGLCSGRHTTWGQVFTIPNHTYYRSHLFCKRSEDFAVRRIERCAPLVLVGLIRVITNRDRNRISKLTFSQHCEQFREIAFIQHKRVFQRKWVLYLRSGQLFHRKPQINIPKLKYHSVSFVSRIPDRQTKLSKSCSLTPIPILCEHAYSKHRKTKMKAKLVLHHDDPPCHKRLDEKAHCDACNVTPDTQSTALYQYCPACDVLLRDMKCPLCEQTFEPAD